ncbi:hypothetical protein JTE90_001271 [Oedothorax gibbosus]|uniref:Uncharacterized protein n=1 Tax=Oedothorax gibbosus TaxID=931172 RepID=A0AAV6V1M0_9ARAC|nr:hypothetical protein JTE90_001271 [Oedothorax gibbosus]
MISLETIIDSDIINIMTRTTTHVLDTTSIGENCQKASKVSHDSSGFARSNRPPFTTRELFTLGAGRHPVGGAFKRRRS